MSAQTQTSTTGPGHEPDAIASGPLLLVVGALVLMLLLTHLAVWLAFLDRHPSSLEISEVPATPARNDWGAAGKAQLAALRAREDANLSGRGEGDDSSRSRISIDEAIRQLARQAARQTAPQAEQVRP